MNSFDWNRAGAVQVGRWLARQHVRDRYPYGLILWGDWQWIELPSPRSQMWPAGRSKR